MKTIHALLSKSTLAWTVAIAMLSASVAQADPPPITAERLNVGPEALAAARELVAERRQYDRDSLLGLAAATAGFSGAVVAAGVTASALTPIGLLMVGMAGVATIFYAGLKRAERNRREALYRELFGEELDRALLLAEFEADQGINVPRDADTVASSAEPERRGLTSLGAGIRR